MNIKVALKLVVMGGLIVAIAYWLRGHDVLTGLAVTLLFLLVMAKLIFAFVAHRRGNSGTGNGGTRPPDAPKPIPPQRPNPPELSAVAS